MSSSASRLRLRRRWSEDIVWHRDRHDRDRREPPPRLVENRPGDVDHHAPPLGEIGGDRRRDAVAEAVRPPVEGEGAVPDRVVEVGLGNGVVILRAVGRRTA